MVVDEADACVLQHRDAMRAVLGAACRQEDKPTLAFVGASISQDFKEELVRERWLSFPVTLEGAGAGLVPPAIQHKCASSLPPHSWYISLVSDRAAATTAAAQRLVPGLVPDPQCIGRADEVHAD